MKQHYRKCCFFISINETQLPKQLKANTQQLFSSKLLKYLELSSLTFKNIFLSGFLHRDELRNNLQHTAV